MSQLDHQLASLATQWARRLGGDGQEREAVWDEVVGLARIRLAWNKPRSAKETIVIVLGVLQAVMAFAACERFGQKEGLHDCSAVVGYYLFRATIRATKRPLTSLESAVISFSDDLNLLTGTG
ncbi:hypothetical protein EHS25_001408 [Saitozyma podzolica]|uniref:Uncharacterized protein n=1 Tax=Saitozyma podzolica TaxID=1890683 RepID=A0A427YFX9_9TREE|nr:hypothetical protein EHS25_001408 [Saitozyma podzolica]